MNTDKIKYLKTYLQELKVPEDLDTSLKKYILKNAKKFTIFNNILYRYNTDNGTVRKVLNKQEAEEILYSYHQHPLGGHLAYSNTLHKIASRYYWDNMTKDIMEYVQKCHRCQCHGSKSLNEQLYPVPVSAKPFERIALDIKHVQTSRAGHRYIIAAIDYLTKYVEARPLRFQTSSEVALFLYEEIICRHGCPITIVSDNGKPFLSDLVKKVCHHYSIIHKTTTPYNPQSNGLIERFNRTLGQILQRRSPEEKQDWHLYLPAALFAYRSIKQDSTKQSPFFLMYGYEPRTPFDNDHRIIGLKTPKFDITLMHRTAHQVFNLNRIRDEAATAIKQTQNVQKKAIEKKILEEKKELKPAFKIGDIVLLYKDYMSTSWSGKLQDKWEGPFIIHHVLGKGTYHIKNANAEDARIRRVHGNRLKIYAMPKVQWCIDNARIIPDAINLEDCELFTHLMEEETQNQQTRRNGINIHHHFSQIQQYQNCKMNSELIDLTTEQVEPVPINELIKSYFKTLYDTLGEEHTVDILNGFLDKEEERNPKYRYRVNGTEVPRKEYVQEVINAFQNGHPLPEVFEDKEPRSPTQVLSPPKTPRLEPMRTKLPVLSPVSVDSVQIDMGFISMFEEDIKKSYQEYLDILREEAMLRRKKEMAMRSFAHNVTEWSHLKFFHPRNDAQNIQQYIHYKTEHLKELLSYQSLHRPLLKKMKKYDRWTEMTSMFGDEHYRPRGF
ncbi:hypothetical protein G6F70_009005 [Rhizopus microsporus]|nr:hypothetical protein G6F70_009005 [Rhizopus microsporus]